MMRTVLPILCLVPLAGCPWEPPVSDNPQSAPPLLNTVAGTVVNTGSAPAASTYVTVFRADDPGPPVGTGGPLTFSAVAARQYTRDVDGVQSAPFAVTQLPDGDYLLSALLDGDGDFSPLSSALAGATCGDWGGAYVSDLVSLEPAVVSVAGGTVKREVTVFVGQEFATERPAFTFPAGPPTISKAGSLDPYAPVLFRVQSTGVSAAFGEELILDLGAACAPETDLPPGACEASPQCPCEVDGLPECAGALWVWLVDADADGLVDPYPAEPQASQGILDIWPRVYLESLDEALGTFEHEGRELPERWVAQSFPLAAEIGGTLAMGGTADLVAPVGVPFPARELSITFAPVFVHYHAEGQMGVDANGPFDVVDPRTGGDLGAVPEGAWGLTLVSFTGQTWTVPNEIGLVPLPSLDPGFDPASQGSVVVLTP